MDGMGRNDDGYHLVTREYHRNSVTFAAWPHGATTTPLVLLNLLQLANLTVG